MFSSRLASIARRSGGIRRLTGSARIEKSHRRPSDCDLAGSFARTAAGILAVGGRLWLIPSATDSPFSFVESPSGSNDPSSSLSFFGPLESWRQNKPKFLLSVAFKLALMEVSKAAGVRTRARTAALAATEKGAKGRKGLSSGRQVAYLELRSRGLVMTPRISRSGLKYSVALRCLTPERGQISRCSSNTSCDMAVLRSGDREVDEDSESAACCSDFRHEKRDTTPLSIRSDESYDLESTAERQPRLRSAALITPPDAEIEEFFTAAERKETQRFALMCSLLLRLFYSLLIVYFLINLR